jgi:hypothetical protein
LLSADLLCPSGTPFGSFTQQSSLAQGTATRSKRSFRLLECCDLFGASLDGMSEHCGSYEAEKKQRSR